MSFFEFQLTLIFCLTFKFELQFEIFETNPGNKLEFKFILNDYYIMTTDQQPV